MKAASCFSGIGAPELGGPQFDWVWCAEVEKFPSAVLAARFPHSVNLGDVTADDFLQRASAFGPLDLLVGGPPCQDFSVAGLRAGTAGDRGNLSLRFMEIAHAIRPRNLLVENVPCWLNMPDNAFGCFLAGIVGADAPVLPAECRNWHWKHEPSFLPGPDGEPAECHSVGGRWQWEVCRWPSAGMAAGPRGRAAWRVFDAQYFGEAQRRRRVFVVADFGEGADPAAVLFERKGVSGNSPPRREAGARVAALTSTGVGTCGADDNQAQAGHLIHCHDVAPTLNTHLGDKQGLEDQHINGGCGHFIAHSLRGEGFDASEDGTGRGAPIVPVAFDCKGTEVHYRDDGSHPTLRSMGHRDSHSNAGGHAAIAFALRGRDEGAVPEIEGDGSKVGALRSASGGSSRDYIQHAWQVRRLTPTECERLQGFPDGFTDIEYRGKRAADGPRYKALGNSWACTNGAWILARLARLLERKDLAA